MDTSITPRVPISYFFRPYVVAMVLIVVMHFLSKVYGQIVTDLTLIVLVGYIGYLVMVILKSGELSKWQT